MNSPHTILLRTFGKFLSSGFWFLCTSQTWWSVRADTRNSEKREIILLSDYDPGVCTLLFNHKTWPWPIWLVFFVHSHSACIIISLQHTQSSIPNHRSHNLCRPLHDSEWVRSWVGRLEHQKGIAPTAHLRSSSFAALQYKIITRIIARLII